MIHCQGSEMQKMLFQKLWIWSPSVHKTWFDLIQRPEVKRWKLPHHSHTGTQVSGKGKTLRMVSMNLLIWISRPEHPLYICFLEYHSTLGDSLDLYTWWPTSLELMWHLAAQECRSGTTDYGMVEIWTKIWQKERTADQFFEAPQKREGITVANWLV